jgi:hypothetical protein
MQGVTCFKYVSDVLLVAMENVHLLGFGMKNAEGVGNLQPWEHVVNKERSNPERVRPG